MLTIKHLTAGYGGAPIIKDLALELREKEIVTLIGPNGAGKSTVLRSIFGQTKIEKESSIQFFGQELIGLSSQEVVQLGITYDPQGRTVFPSLTVEENLDMGAFILVDATHVRERKDYVYAQFPRLKERRDQKAKLLSGGEQQMLAIARCLILSPKLLLLDEPSIGLAPKVVEEVFTKLQEIRNSGVSILMVEQNAIQALLVSDRAYVLELGENRLEGSGEKLLHDPKVGELYLGH